MAAVLQEAPLVVTTCAMLGVFSLGIYPVMLELRWVTWCTLHLPLSSSVECTYPLDECVVTGLCYLSSALQVALTTMDSLPSVQPREYRQLAQGSILMVAENFFNSPLATERERRVQRWEGWGGGGEGG